MSNILQDISLITKIIGCDYTYYNQQNSSVDPYYESTIYLVNNGDNLNNNSNDTSTSYTDLYYGARKLSDTLIVESYPDSPNYPNDKIYIQPQPYELTPNYRVDSVSELPTTELTEGDIAEVVIDENHDDDTTYYRWEIVDNVGSWVYLYKKALQGYQIYFKHDDIVLPIATVDQVVQVRPKADSPNVYLIYNVGQEHNHISEVLGVDVDGNIDSSIYDKLKSKLYRDIYDEFKSQVATAAKWQPIVPPVNE